jgi:uncharacterized repeat protein (TIGR01451 family)
MSRLRMLSIAAAALLMASCRSLPTPAPSPLAGPAGSPPSDIRLVACRECEPAPVSSQGPCQGPACDPALACGPCLIYPEPPVPLVGGCLICDGGDHGSPARLRGDGLANLTAGDTVARYRGEDDLETEARIAVANCTCVFAPRFASVREVIRPYEDSVIAATLRVETDDTVEIDTGLDPVVADRRRIVPDVARNETTGLEVETAAVPLEVADELLPDEAVGEEHPQATLAEEHPEPLLRVQRLEDVVGFDIPYAWTCLQEASVMIAEQQATVISSDRTTATLRIEEEGRAELTICKSAGSTTAKAGEELDFTIAFLNSGERPLDEIVLVDALPSRLQYVTDSADATVPASFSTGRGDDGSVVLTWRLTEPLLPGETGFVRFRTRVR